MDSDLHAEHAEHAQQAQHAQHAQQAQHAQHAQQAQQAQHDYDYDAEFEDVSSEALAELDQVLTHARADPADALAASTLQEPDEEKPLTKLQLGRARLAAQKAATKRSTKLKQASMARAAASKHQTNQKRASRADVLAKEEASRFQGKESDQGTKQAGETHHRPKPHASQQKRDRARMPTRSFAQHQHEFGPLYRKMLEGQRALVGDGYTYALSTVWGLLGIHVCSSSLIQHVRAQDLPERAKEPRDPAEKACREPLLRLARVLEEERTALLGSDGEARSSRRSGSGTKKKGPYWDSSNFASEWMYQVLLYCRQQESKESWRFGPGEQIWARVLVDYLHHCPDTRDDTLALVQHALVQQRVRPGVSSPGRIQHAADTLLAISNMLECFRKRPEYESCADVQLHRAVLHEQRLLLGDTHADTLTSMYRLAFKLQQQCAHARARARAMAQLCPTEASAQRRQLRGVSSEALAELDQQRNREAQSLYREALQGQCELLGGRPAQAARSMAELSPWTSALPVATLQWPELHFDICRAQKHVLWVHTHGATGPDRFPSEFAQDSGFQLRRWTCFRRGGQFDRDTSGSRGAGVLNGLYGYVEKRREHLMGPASTKFSASDALSIEYLQKQLSTMHGVHFVDSCGKPAATSREWADIGGERSATSMLRRLQHSVVELRRADSWAGRVAAPRMAYRLGYEYLTLPAMTYRVSAALSVCGGTGHNTRYYPHIQRAEESPQVPTYEYSHARWNPALGAWIRL